MMMNSADDPAPNSKTCVKLISVAVVLPVVPTVTLYTVPGTLPLNFTAYVTNAILYMYS